MFWKNAEKLYNKWFIMYFKWWWSVNKIYNNKGRAVVREILTLKIVNKSLNGNFVIREAKHSILAHLIF